MKPRLILTALIAAAAVLTATARTVSDFFTADAASRAIPLIDTNTRLDMVDYFTGGIDRQSANVYQGKAQLLEADSVTLRFRPGEAVLSRLTMVAQGSDTILVLIDTFSLPQPDSRIALFDTDWQPLDAKSLQSPVLDDWLTADGRSNRRDVEGWLPFMLAEASIDPVTATLTYTNTLPQYYSDNDDLQRVHAWIRPSLTYRLKGKRFVQVK